MMMMMKWVLTWMIMLSAKIKKRRGNDELVNWEHEGAQNPNNKGGGWQAKLKNVAGHLYTQKKRGKCKEKILGYLFWAQGKKMLLLSRI